MNRLLPLLALGAALLCLAPVTLQADGKTTGWCQDGNYTVSVPGGAAPSVNRFQRSFPSCTVTVFLTGTVTLAPLFSDDNGTVKANPFTAASTGQWFFYAADGRYDVRFSGSGIAAPFTIGDLFSFDTARPFQIRVVCDPKFNAATLDARMVNAAADLPTAGGTLDARCAEGAQTWAAAVSISKPVKIMLGASTVTCTAAAGASACLTLTGDGASVEGVNPTETIFVTTSLTAYGINISGNKQRFANFTLRGACGNPCTVHNQAEGFNSGNVNDTLIENVVVEQWGADCLNTGGSSNYWRIVHSIIQNCQADGVFLAGGGGHTVLGNTIRNVGSNGVDMNSGQNRIIGNYIYTNGGNYNGIDCDGVLVSAIGQNVDETVIQGNTIYNNHCVGVRIRADDVTHSASYILVEGNEIFTNTLDGVLLDASVAATCGTTNYIMVHNNNVHNNVRNGIALAGGGSTCGTWTAPSIRGNTVFGQTSGGAYGIAIVFGVNPTITNNIVTGNATQILTAGSTNPTVYGNQTANSAAGAGFYSANCIGVNIATGCYGTGSSIDLASAIGTDGVFFGDRTNGWLMTEDNTGDLEFRVTASGTPNSAYRFRIPNSSATGVTAPFGITVGSGGASNQHYIPNILGGSASLTFNGGGALAAQTCYAGSIAVSSAASTMPAFGSIPAAARSAGLTWFTAADVNAAVVTVCNVTAAPIANPGAQTFNALVFQY